MALRNARFGKPTRHPDSPPPLPFIVPSWGGAGRESGLGNPCFQWSVLGCIVTKSALKLFLLEIFKERQESAPSSSNRSCPPKKLRQVCFLVAIRLYTICNSPVIYQYSTCNRLVVLEIVSKHEVCRSRGRQRPSVRDRRRQPGRLRYARTGARLREPQILKRA